VASSVLGTIETVAADIASFGQDVSKYAPPGVLQIAGFLVGEGAGAVARVLKAIDGGAPADDPVAVLTAALKLASDLQMKTELGA
jgi:hypothetical protein